MSDIQEGCWFIENKELRLLADGSGQKDPLFLAIAGIPEPYLRETAALHHFEGLPDLFFIFL